MLGDGLFPCLGSRGPKIQAFLHRHMPISKTVMAVKECFGHRCDGAVRSKSAPGRMKGLNTKIEIAP